MGDNSVRLREEIAKKRNYLDLLRSGVGSWCVTHACFVVAPAAGGASQEAMPVFALQAAIFTVAVVIQTLQWDEGISLFAPIFFLQGLTVGVAGYEAAIFAGVLIWAINSVLPNPATFLFIFAIEIPVFSYFYESFALHDLLAVFLIMIPVVLSWLLGKRLLLGMKRRVFRENGLRV